MSVHFKAVKVSVREDNTARRCREHVALPQAVRPVATIADLVVESKGGQVLIAEAKAIQAEREKARESAALRSATLMELAERTFSRLLGQSWVYDKAVNRSRFSSLGWGSDVACQSLANDLQSAYRSPASYVKAFEALTEQPCRFVPPVVYRNAQQVESYR